MCRRLICGICLLLVLACCFPALALAAGDADYLQQDFTAEDLYRLCGIDPEDQEAVDLFLAWLSSLEDDMQYDSFVKPYLMMGYDERGVDAAFYAYCSIRGYDIAEYGYFNGSQFERWYGDSVRIVYVKPNNEGVPSDYYLGWTSSSPTSSTTSSLERRFNLSQMERDIKNAVTYSDLSPLTTILNNILTYVKYIDDTTRNTLGPALTQIKQNLDTIKTDVAAVKDDLVSFTDYISSSSGTLTYYNFSNGSSTSGNFTPTGIFDLIRLGFNGVNLTVRGAEVERYKQFDEFLNPGFSLLSAYSFVGSDGSKSSASRYSYSTFHDLLQSLFLSSNNADMLNFQSLRSWLNGLPAGTTSVSLRQFGYTDDGSLISVAQSVNADLVTVMSTLAQNIQRDTAALRFVLADDDAIRLHAANKPLEGAIEDNFTGGSDAAPSTDDIKDAADISSGLQTIFQGNPSSSGDFFTVAGDPESSNFFSQQTADSLDTVGNDVAGAAALSDRAVDDWMDDYIFDDDGFGKLRDDGMFTISGYLGGVS